ncbi:MAG: sigma-70 family RNA polymerase sigma factor [Betaproteobacteria bacterium]|nr:sigma-70 family RNA polymerase sigma factor [Betaproteobacteria bacterium]NBP37638.1 sigma-70 family RNA polymerase sigma factor [Betaproteobacteria bacterium]NBT71796.1 sigma-70 family RNA polymerase sigma factor [Betaproteobacteria bacterium]NBY55955.1 sigma-70 family RNA polymerase sigma factor [Betaproteobacteria bacterium]NCY05874.1 sigma-70 family RNA polymerase sigma factor [Betaproteobacteria bacterium]
MIERLLRGEPGVKEWQRSDFTIGASINRGSVAMQSQARTVTVIDRVINHQYQEGSLAGVSQAAAPQSLPSTSEGSTTSVKPSPTSVSRLASKSASRSAPKAIRKSVPKPSSRHGLGRPRYESDGPFRLNHQANRAYPDHDLEAQLEPGMPLDPDTQFESGLPFDPEAQLESEARFNPDVQFDPEEQSSLAAPADAGSQAANASGTRPQADGNADSAPDAQSLGEAAATVAVDISHEFYPARLEEHRKALMRMARLRVRSHEWAEDAVQEALIAAYQSRASYKGRGSVRSWLRGILDHKIHDRFRAECHYTQADWIDDDASSAEEQLDWAARCGVMGDRANEDPMEICSRRQRLSRVAKTLSDMAPGMREAFILQVVEDRPSLEVANRLGISENNCWIRVHRARKKLLLQRED